MLTQQQILTALDHSNDGHYSYFVQLSHPYSFLIDSRLNVFTGNNDEWAIVFERLGFSPRSGGIELQLFYYGNCLINLEINNDIAKNSYSVFPVDNENYRSTVEGEVLRKGAVSWRIRGTEVFLSHDKREYISAGVGLKEYEPGEIGIEEAARLIVTKHAGLFRATDSELYKSIPPSLSRILVIDSWYHHDFASVPHKPMDYDAIRFIYDSNKSMTTIHERDFPDFDTFAELIRNQEKQNEKAERKQKETNRPGSYETWVMIAEVIVSNDAEKYKPTQKANSHWSNYPESGVL